MDLTRVKAEASIIALNKMMRGGHFSICAVTHVADIHGIKTDGPAFTILRALHCVDFKDMTPDVRNAIPELIKECLLNKTDVYQFDMPTPAPQVMERSITVIDVSFTEVSEPEPEPPQKKGGFRFRLPWSRE